MSCDKSSEPGSRLSYSRSRSLGELSETPCLPPPVLNLEIALVSFKLCVRIQGNRDYPRVNPFSNLLLLFLLFHSFLCLPAFISCHRIYIVSKILGIATYDHRLRRIGHPVRSAIHKPQIGRLVVGWVTTSEYLLLYVFIDFVFGVPPHPPRLGNEMDNKRSWTW